jgi:phosphatidate cytidylyltransferase
MKTRVMIGAVLIAVLALLTWLDAQWEGGYVYVAVISVVAAAALLEFYRMAERAGARVPMAGGVVAGLLIIWAQWLMGLEVMRERMGEWMFSRPGAVVGILTVSLLGSFLLRAWRFQIEGALLSIGATLLGLLYIPVMVTFMTAIRREWGVAGFLSFVAVCKSGDIGAYLVGHTWGRVKLAPRVSPGKTVEGGVAGVLTSVAVALVLSRVGMLGLSLWVAGLFGLMIGVSSVVGDLGESVLKRDSKIKDSASFLPGFGGVLDMIDDLLYTAPLAYYCFRLVGS